MHTGWNQPEIYFDEEMRKNTSGFALASQEEVRKNLTRLQADLSSGKWDEKFGHLRTLDSFDSGFMFVKFNS